MSPAIGPSPNRSPVPGEHRLKEIWGSSSPSSSAVTGEGRAGEQIPPENHGGPQASSRQQGGEASHTAQPSESPTQTNPARIPRRIQVMHDLSQPLDALTMAIHRKPFHYPPSQVPYILLYVPLLHHHQPAHHPTKPKRRSRRGPRTPCSAWAVA